MNCHHLQNASPGVVVPTHTKFPFLSFSLFYTPHAHGCGKRRFAQLVPPRRARVTVVSEHWIGRFTASLVSHQEILLVDFFLWDMLRTTIQVIL